jgi:hypothetical protein
LTHLLIENVYFAEGLVRIRSKPELFWRIKTRDRRDLPLTGLMADLLPQLIDNRRAGFVFLNKLYFDDNRQPAGRFASDQEFRRHLKRVAAGMGDATEAQQRRRVTAYCRTMGQIPLKRLRIELMKITAKIGCPDFT